ncbi:MAG TPA: hypothetical protein VNZ53_21400 [Steroidobacteraceae bacterium]|jgi:hypothetical protein|nr:hypothetical protein [Steroidobacteraceae bacterium]
MVDEGLLQRMQRPIPRKGFDRRDLRALVHDRKGQAGIDAWRVPFTVRFTGTMSPPPCD